MAFNLAYPTATAMRRIDADLSVRARADMPGLKLCPVINEPTVHVAWWQMDSAYGLMQMRGVDGQPPKVQRLGDNRYVQEAGFYGEYIPITEKEILERCDPLDSTRRIDLTAMVALYQKQLIDRQTQRMEANVWTMFGTGTITIPLASQAGPNGTNVYTDAYTIQTFTSTVPWSVSATSTPLADFQTIQQKYIGHGVSFGADAEVWMNMATAFRLLNNSNASDFGGKRDAYGATINRIEQYNAIFAGQGVPQIRINDNNYLPYPVSGIVSNPLAQVKKYIPDGLGILIGKRTDGNPVAHFQMTVQAMQPGAGQMPGEYAFVKDYNSGMNAPLEVGKGVEVHRGFNGGIAFEYPASVVACTFG